MKCNFSVKPFVIRIGFHTVGCTNPHDRTILSVKKGGKLTFLGSAHIGRWSKIIVNGNGCLTLGDNFAISASTDIVCYKNITFGRDIQFSWDCLVMDSDTHTILDEQMNKSNENRAVVFGNKIWIGCRCTVMKGSIIPDNCVIGACSFVSGNKFQAKTVIAGHPAKSIKAIGGWHI